MAGTYTPTGSYSNLTRLELEQLRRGDFAAGGKALTVGDSGLAPEGVVGPGNVNAEPFTSVPAMTMSEIVTVTPPTQPGPQLLTYTNFGGQPTQTVQWFGPNLIVGYQSGTALHSGYFNILDDTWFDGSADYVTAGVQPGDLLCILEAGGSGGGPFVNENRVVPIVSVVDANFLQVGAGQADDDAASYAYMVIRPNAKQLFAVPGSGPTGQEQTFLMVNPTDESIFHGTVGPTVDDINPVRVKNIVRPTLALNSSIDRSDAIYPSPAPGGDLTTLGYRVILYPDDGTGTGPDLSSPIASLNPIIDPNIPAGDQRMTIDYAAGVVRFSCAPAVGGAIKVPGGVNATTGRLNLYATFWAHDTRYMVGGAARPYYRIYTAPFLGAVTLTSEFNVVLITTQAGARTITLPAASTMVGQVLVIKDVGGMLHVNPATIARSGSDLIEMVLGNYTWEASYGTLRLLSIGSAWVMI